MPKSPASLLFLALVFSAPSFAQTDCIYALFAQGLAGMKRTDVISGLGIFIRERLVHYRREAAAGQAEIREGFRTLHRELDELVSVALMDLITDPAERLHTRIAALQCLASLGSCDEFRLEDLKEELILFSDPEAYALVEAPNDDLFWNLSNAYVALSPGNGWATVEPIAWKWFAPSDDRNADGAPIWALRLACFTFQAREKGYVPKFLLPNFHQAAEELAEFLSLYRFRHSGKRLPAVEDLYAALRGAILAAEVRDKKPLTLQKAVDDFVSDRREVEWGTEELMVIQGFAEALTHSALETCPEDLENSYYLLVLAIKDELFALERRIEGDTEAYTFYLQLQETLVAFLEKFSRLKANHPEAALATTSGLARLPYLGGPEGVTLLTPTRLQRLETARQRWEAKAP
ncbi:hypothetical protein K2X33_15285 [bacterium]|nr:hypothetical protein [bacterium]